MEIIIAWITNHWADILAVYGGAVALATTIVKITPTQEDDAILAKIISVANWFSTIAPKK